MLQNLRDRLKGAVAVVVILIFVVPLVLIGVDSLFVGSAGGTDAASVNGQAISKSDLQRELDIEKGRLQQQMNLEPSSPQLEDSVLMGPVLDRMIRREAMIQVAKKGGMGAPKDDVERQIKQMEVFQVDGVFDENLYRERISFRFTPATFLAAMSKDYLLSQLNTGLFSSSFSTDLEFNLLAGINQQERTFFTIEIPRDEPEAVEVSEDDVRKYYEDNSSRYLEPESVVVNYIELSLATLADSIDVTESEIKAVYEAEVAEFDADPKLVVAHILIEEKDGVEATIEAVKQGLAEEKSFSDLAKEFSDDLGSRNSGGSLGVMVDEAYPEEFVAAAKTLTVGQVSDAVKTDVGTHFIKLTEIKDAEPPAFEDRKASIKRLLAEQKAQEEFILKSEQLDEQTFGAESLKSAAEFLGLEVKASSSFTRRGGVGIAADRKIVDAAFADDVLKQGHNSPVINIEGDRAIVLRLNKHQPELLKPFDGVKDQIRQQLVNQRLDEALQQKGNALIVQLNGGADAKVVAEEAGYTFALHENVTRSSFDGNGRVLQKAFSLARPASEDVLVLDKVALAGSGLSVIGLSRVQSGDVEKLEDAQKQSTRRQIAFQINRAEMSAFENFILESSDIDRPDTEN